VKNSNIKSDQTFYISNVYKEFQTMQQITTIMGELLKILPRYEQESL